MRGLSLVVASGGYSLLPCLGFSLQWLLLLWSTGSRHAGSVVVAHWLRCFVACGIEPVSPALAGGFLTTVPTGKPSSVIFTVSIAGVL